MPQPEKFDLDASLDTLTRRVLGGERRALAQAITLVESTRADHRVRARALLERLGRPASVARRIGLSGTPGVGKSTFIEALGVQLCQAGHRVAVLAVDPSSARSGGSILGDKTRMEQLSRQPQAFIRPSPSLGTLGGVARRTREAIRLVEAAGFDTILVETVGVGQSETVVAEMTDVFVLLLAPAGGDELQGVKRGIMEIADLIVVNKADGDLAAQAEATRADYASALHLMRARPGDAKGFPKALKASAISGAGLDDVWGAITELHDYRTAAGLLQEARAAQRVQAMRRALERMALDMLAGDAASRALLAQAEAEVSAGETDPEEAAERVIAGFQR
ncbi:MAG: methylmalonyl Co-A mutase-associated GTPase MeaB [Pseudomonadota bacterium]